MRLPTLARTFWIALVLLGLVALGVVFTTDSNWVRIPAQLLIVSLLTLAFLALFGRLLRWLLWRVGRRLAFSYFLLGVLPIPMVLLLGGLGLYLLSGYFLSHEYRAAALAEQAAVERVAATRLAHSESGAGEQTPSADGRGFAYYLDGKKVVGHELAPMTWPEWLEQGEESEGDSKKQGASLPSFWELSNGQLTLAAVAKEGNRGVLAFRLGSVTTALSERSGVWVRLGRPEEEGGSMVRLHLFAGEYALGAMTAGAEDEARIDFFGISKSEDIGWFDKPIIWWGEVAGPVLAIEDGNTASEWTTASLNGTINGLRRKFFSTSAELNTAAWGSLIGVTGLLSSIYLVAVLMAFYMIFTLTRAVNRLSHGTDAVIAGDFSRRIPVNRKDQIGELQSSFNNMTEHLESLIETAAQKEVIEKELEIARDLQESLLPAELPDSERVEFSTLFEPSSAIGGDYFDILRIDEDRLAVVIADVSGHGLPTGLRMAMLKAALVILVEERKPPNEILARLNRVVRAENRQRFFVTATIAVIDFRRNVLEITNAGHPPTYIVSRGEVQEVLLPGSPLGALDENYNHHEIELHAGDVAVWMSDGLIEATNEADEPFGYDATIDALAGDTASAQQVRDRLLRAVEEHTGGAEADDDRTLVAMRYFPDRAPGATSSPRNP